MQIGGGGIFLLKCCLDSKRDARKMSIGNAQNRIENLTRGIVEANGVRGRVEIVVECGGVGRIADKGIERQELGSLAVRRFPPGLVPTICGIRLAKSFEFDAGGKSQSESLDWIKA